MAHFSFTVGAAPHYIPEIKCVPFSFEGKPVLKVEAAIEGPHPEGEKKHTEGGSEKHK